MGCTLTYVESNFYFSEFQILHQMGLASEVKSATIVQNIATEQSFLI
jgi:hypothetical protein